VQLDPSVQMLARLWSEPSCMAGRGRTTEQVRTCKHAYDIIMITFARGISVAIHSSLFLYYSQQSLQVSLNVSSPDIHPGLCSEFSRGSSQGAHGSRSESLFMCEFAKARELTLEPKQLSISAAGTHSACPALDEKFFHSAHGSAHGIL